MTNLEWIALLIVPAAAPLIGGVSLLVTWITQPREDTPALGHHPGE